MGDHEFDAGLNWWSTTPRTSSSTSSTAFDGSSPSATCSAQIADGAIDSSTNMQIPSFPRDWNQSLLRSSTSERVDPTLHAMLQEPLNYHHQQHQFHHIGSQEMMLQGLFEPELKAQQQTIFDQRSLNCEALGNSTNYGHGSSSDLLAKFPLFLNSSSPKQQISSANSLQFSNNAAFWNATANAVGYQSTVPVQFGTGQSYEQNTQTCSSITTKMNFGGVHKKSSSGNSSSGSEPPLKRTRIETPSPLPTFKVRKEKLGDRITALQQLVAPFGKTDTASVLHEAIEYIRFLHDQVNVLTTPYLKNGHPIEHQQSSEAKQDLRSKGLCLVPIESTYPVASDTTADFWTPTFGGTFR